MVIRRAPQTEAAIPRSVEFSDIKYQRQLFSCWIVVVAINWCALAMPPPDFATHDLPLILEHLKIQNAERQRVISIQAVLYQPCQTSAVLRDRFASAIQLVPRSGHLF